MSVIIKKFLPPPQKNPSRTQMGLSSIFIASFAHKHKLLSLRVRSDGHLNPLTHLEEVWLLCWEEQAARRCSLSESHLQRGQDAAGDDDEEPKVHVKELADHVGHVCREHEEEQAEAHSTEVFPQTPGQDTRFPYSQGIHQLPLQHSAGHTMAAP